MARARGASRDGTKVGKPRRRRARWLSAGALGVAALWVACRDVGPPRQVVMVTIDTTRADHLGCYRQAAAAGTVATPSLDAFARESYLYEDAMTSAPITLVAHATIMTGLDPASHGVRTNGSFRLPEGATTLAEMLTARGFATAAFVGSFVLHHEFGLDQGFGLYDDTMPRQEPGRKFYFQERRAAEVLGRAADWAEARADSPFFLWAHLYDPHAPYDPPAPFDARFANSLYDGEIAYVDGELGRFFERMRKAGILDHALVIVTSDHGEGLGEHGESTHGLFVYQSTLHVPLIVRPPGGLRSGVRVKEPVGLVDVAPSIVAAVGLQDAPPMDGRALPGWGGESQSAAPAGASTTPGALTKPYYFENLLPHYSFGWAGLHGLREGPKKLIHAVGTEIYDLAADPREMHDLGPGDPDAAGRLLEAMEHVIAKGASGPGGGEGAGASQIDLSVEAREKLLALGYIVSGAPVVSETGGEPGPDPRTMLPIFEGIERAKELLRAKRGEEAIAALEAIDRTGPPSPGVRALLGQALMEKGSYDAAIAVLERARAIAPQDYEIRRRLAEGRYAQGAYEAAATEAREALRLNPRNAESRSVLGAALARLGRTDEAIASFQEAIAERPEEPALQYNLGLALETAGRVADAERAFGRAAVLGPEDPNPRLALGRSRLATGRNAEARVAFEEAVRLDPSNATAYESLGIALARLGDNAAALAQFDHARSLDPARAEPYYDRALVLERLGRNQEAAEGYREFLARWTGDPARRAAAEERLRKLGGR